MQVGVFLKNSSKFAELRPKSKWLELALALPRTVTDARITRKIRVSDRKTWHVIRLHGPADVDDKVRGWLTGAYLAAE